MIYSRHTGDRDTPRKPLSEILEFAKKTMRVNKVYSHISVNNTASIKTAKKQGLVMSDDSYYEEFHGEKFLHDIYRLDL